ncbi:MAG TPA: SPFH domain-containing protein [Candidatus Paceibacterota bacterium]|nr:SPFH domain-containing protein [Candidatus Paceibacterota bacterium]
MGETFVEMLLNNMMTLLPFVIIMSYEGGVRWTLGRNPRELKPGFHWKWWFFHQIERMSVVDQVIELQIQSVITQDGELVCFSVNIGFHIVDVVAHFCGVQDFIESTRALAMTHLAKEVRKKPYQDLVTDLSKLERSLQGTLTTRLKDWGTEIFSVGFTNFAKVPLQVRIFGDSSVHI